MIALPEYASWSYQQTISLGQYSASNLVHQ
jgi:hypothetical protein